MRASKRPDAGVFWTTHSRHLPRRTVLRQHDLHDAVEMGFSVLQVEVDRQGLRKGQCC
jgi:hypothetical protein